MESTLLSLAALLVVAKLAEGVAGRLGFSSLPAYIFAGVLLGPVLNVVDISDELGLFFSLGIIFLFFLIGVEEIDIAGFVATLRGRFFIAATIAFMVPFGIGLALTTGVMDLPPGAALPLSGLLGLSSLGVAAKVLADLDHLKETVGIEIFTTVALLELLGLLLVGFSIQGGEVTPQRVLIVLLEMVAFASLAWFLTAYVFPSAVLRLRRTLGIAQISFSLVVGGLLLVVAATELIGLHGSLGALLFGIALSGLPHSLRTEIMPGVRSLAHGLFVPLFFAAAGLHLDLSFLSLAPLVIVATVLAAVGGKFLGAAVATFVTRLRSPLTIATGIMAKGVMEIALLLVMLEEGLLPPEIFSLMTVVMLGFIFLVPLAMKLTITRAAAEPAIDEKLVGTVMPFLARYALANRTVSDALSYAQDASRQFANTSTTVEEFAEKFVAPEQQDYVILEEDDPNIVAGVVPLRRIRRVPRDDWPTTPIEGLIRRRFHLTWPAEPLDDLVDKMAEHSLSVVPVVDPQSGHFMGAIRSRDVFALMVEPSS